MPAPLCSTVRPYGFFFVKTLKRHYLLESIPLPKEPRTLPTVLSQGEVTTLIESASKPLRPIAVSRRYRYQIGPDARVDQPGLAE